jgi:dolichyl-phosphate-mannose-protein mannosyltransferase
MSVAEAPGSRLAMPSLTAAPPREAVRYGESARVTAALAAVLLLAAGLRLWGVTHDLPFSYFGDELHLTKMSMAMGTGDLNPHWFHKPALLNYLLLAGYGAYFALGRALGWFSSADAFAAHFFTDPAPFLWIGRLLVAAFGVLAVYLVYRIGRQAFGSPAAGLTAALAAAVLAPMVASSQEIKQDIPCAALMALSILLFLDTRDSDRLRPLALASLLAGAAMGTHYYAVVLVPAYLAMEGLAAISVTGRGSVRPRAATSSVGAHTKEQARAELSHDGHRRPWRRALLRAAVVPALFLAGFFLTAPYNFLDPTWPTEVGRTVAKAFGVGVPPGHTEFEADSKIAYTPGPSSWGGGLADVAQVLTSRRSLGLPLTLVAALGLGATLVRRETRWYGLLVLFPTAAFVLAAVLLATYHAQPRHLNALYPLLATLLWPGVQALARLVPASPGRRRAAIAGGAGVALALAVLLCVPTAVEAVRYNLRLTRPDSRLVAYRWIVANLPRDGRVLLDDYGPPLNPDRRALARQHALLATLPPGPFTNNQDRRLAVLERYPPAEGFDLDELGHQWWRQSEKSDAELRRDPSDLEMSSPLVSRQPKTAEEYAAAGVRWVITNSNARDRYFTDRFRGFPSFRRFYESLGRARLVKTFDPRDLGESGGKGPVVWIYDLSPLAPPSGAR